MCISNMNRRVDFGFLRGLPKVAASPTQTLAMPLKEAISPKKITKSPGKQFFHLVYAKKLENVVSESYGTKKYELAQKVAQVPHICGPSHKPRPHKGRFPKSDT